MLATERTQDPTSASGKRIEPSGRSYRWGWHGSGREVALLATQGGAHVVVADRDGDAAIHAPVKCHRDCRFALADYRLNQR